jgi:hypothetical protein
MEILSTTYLDHKRKSKLKIKGIINPLERSVRIIQSTGNVIVEGIIYFKDVDEWNSFTLLDGRVVDCHFDSYENNTISFSVYEVIDNVRQDNKSIHIQLKLETIKLT